MNLLLKFLRRVPMNQVSGVKHMNKSLPERENCLYGN